MLSLLIMNRKCHVLSTFVGILAFACVYTPPKHQIQACTWGDGKKFHLFPFFLLSSSFQCMMWIFDQVNNARDVVSRHKALSCSAFSFLIRCWFILWVIMEVRDMVEMIIIKRMKRSVDFWLGDLMALVRFINRH